MRKKVLFCFQMPLCNWQLAGNEKEISEGSCAIASIYTNTWNTAVCLTECLHSEIKLCKVVFSLHCRFSEQRRNSSPMQKKFKRLLGWKCNSFSWGKFIFGPAVNNSHLCLDRWKAQSCHKPRQRNPPPTLSSGFTSLGFIVEEDGKKSAAWDGEESRTSTWTADMIWIMVSFGREPTSQITQRFFSSSEPLWALKKSPKLLFV